MLKPFTSRRFSEAMRLALAAGITEPKQIKRIVRRRGTWFITCELPV